MQRLLYFLFCLLERQHLTTRKKESVVFYQQKKTVRLPRKQNLANRTKI